MLFSFKTNKLNLNIGLYRDDGLLVCNLTPRLAELKKKEICQIFKDNGLKITILANQIVVHFLDITLDIDSGVFKPFMKPNDTPLYINTKSNHPPSILKNVPLGVNRRLSKISANQEVFEEAVSPYQEALKKSGFEHKLKFEPPSEGKKKTRSRRIIWFNPPFSLQVKTNVGKKFLAILDSCFPHGHPLHKILNRNTVKLSYKCMPNMKLAISKHNASIKKMDNAGGAQPIAL